MSSKLVYKYTVRKSFPTCPAYCSFCIDASSLPSSQPSITFFVAVILAPINVSLSLPLQNLFLVYRQFHSPLSHSHVYLRCEFRCFQHFPVSWSRYSCFFTHASWPHGETSCRCSFQLNACIAEALLHAHAFLRLFDYMAPEQFVFDQAFACHVICVGDNCFMLLCRDSCMNEYIFSFSSGQLCLHYNCYSKYFPRSLAQVFSLHQLYLNEKTLLCCSVC